ncbi:MAG TPA: AMP-binding protein [Cyclobacteriaceae bacterium]
MNNYLWFSSYPEHTPHEIDPDIYKSLPDLFNQSFIKFSDKIAFENFGKKITYSNLSARSASFAAYLQDKGLKKGDKIAIQLPNLLQYAVALFGSLRAGLVVVNTNPLYTSREMEHQFRDSGAKAIIILANFASTLEKIIDATKIELVIITEIGDMLGPIKGAITNYVVKHIKKMVPRYNLPQATPFKDTLKASPRNFKEEEINGDDLAFLQYTGGTTGVSKGAMLTHRNMVANLEQVCCWMQSSDMKEGEEIMITALPLYHVFALTCNALVISKLGGNNLLITNPRDMKGFIKELSKHKFTVMTGVNTLFNGLLNQEKFKTLDFSHLKFSFGGGMAVQRPVAEKWLEVTNSPLAEGYGLTETAPVLTANPLGKGQVRIGTIGLPLPSTIIKILNDDGEEVPIGAPGEICAKGPQIMRGYWKNDEETEKVFMNGWFKTGDVGIMNEEGFIKIVDRKKEMILVSGFNVYPNEVEETIASMDKVLEVGAIGVPDRKSTEAVKVFVVKRDQSLTKKQITEFCKDKLTAYKCPKYIEFVDELPKSNVGKILRRVLKEEDLKKNTYL